MKTKAFGFDLGASTLKAVWLNSAPDTLSLEACAVLPTPQRGMQSESLVDQETMAEALKQVMAEGKITSKHVHLALADNQVFTKVIEMPVLSDKELSSAIKWEAEQYIPASLTTMTLDYVVLKEVQTQSGPRMLVLLVAAPTSVIKRYQKVLDLAGLTIASVETEILSLVRAAIPPGGSPTSFLIHVGSLSTSLAIIQKGIVVFTYSIPVGDLAVNRAIASDFGFSLQQAEAYKKTYGIADQNTSGKIGKAITPILATIVSETRKALAYYQEKYHEDPLDQIILSGGTAAVPGMTGFFAKQTGVETVLLNPFEIWHITSVPEEISRNAAELGTAIGLALKDYE